MSDAPTDALPFVAPCHRLPALAPLRWLRLGWRDLIAAPRASLAYGAGIFVLSAAVSAIGLYAISAQLARGGRPSLRRCLFEVKRRVGDQLVYSLILMVICLVWVRAGSGVGSVFALVVFAASAFSLPMLLERRTDSITAVVTSINAVLRNKPAMVVWIALIVGAIAIGFATWHAYRETIDASAWPAYD